MRTNDRWLILRRVSAAALFVSFLFAGGCSKESPVAKSTAQDSVSKDQPDDKDSPKEVKFKDNVQSNVAVPTGLDGLVFFDTTGNRVALEQYLGKQNVVLVFTEGFAGMLCPFCKTQTSRLVANHDKFQDLDTQVLVVYPGSREHLDEFVKAAKVTEKAEVDAVPFPILLDEDLSATGFFRIQSNLAHPSTFIIDKQGNVRLAYVGADMTADRPSVNAILETIREANEGV